MNIKILVTCGGCGKDNLSNNITINPEINEYILPVDFIVQGLEFECECGTNNYIELVKHYQRRR